jgi:hypothetical protein
MVLCTVVTCKLRKLEPWAIMRAVHGGAIRQLPESVVWTILAQEPRKNSP